MWKQGISTPCNQKDYEKCPNCTTRTQTVQRNPGDERTNVENSTITGPEGFVP